MDYHQNARTILWSREKMARMVLEQGFTLKLAAASFNVSAKTAAKWARRYREGHRPHTSLGLAPPIRRAGLEQNNLLTLHT